MERKVTITNSQGQKAVADIVTIFRINDLNSDYVVYTFNQRDENNNIIDAVPSEYETYNKFNGETPDIVSMDEIQAWINNGCDTEWLIDEAILIDGQTFGQRIQGNMEGMAENNYYMYNNTKRLSK